MEHLINWCPDERGSTVLHRVMGRNIIPTKQINDVVIATSNILHKIKYMRN